MKSLIKDGLELIFIIIAGLFFFYQVLKMEYKHSQQVDPSSEEQIIEDPNAH